MGFNKLSINKIIYIIDQWFLNYQQFKKNSNIFILDYYFVLFIVSLGIMKQDPLYCVACITYNT